MQTIKYDKQELREKNDFVKVCLHSTMFVIETVEGSLIIFKHIIYVIHIDMHFFFIKY